MKTYIVIPAYNEAKKIALVIRGLKAEGYENIIVVDDGSLDSTFEEAQKENIEVLRHSINRGQGAALQTGINYALFLGADYIVTFDADGQHNPKQIKDLLAPLEKKGYDIAVGSRFLKRDSNTPYVRKLFLKGGALSFRLFYHVNLTDSHNGFRALTRKAAEKIRITADDSAHASQIVEEIYRNKLKYKEVPVTITYTDYSIKKGQRTKVAFKIISRMIIDKFLK